MCLRHGFTSAHFSEKYNPCAKIVFQVILLFYETNTEEYFVIFITAWRLSTRNWNMTESQKIGKSSSSKSLGGRTAIFWQTNYVHTSIQSGPKKSGTPVLILR